MIRWRVWLLLGLGMNGWLLPAQHSIARIWNETLLEAIRDDQARPTVHARNLFHHSILMYDLWTVYEGTGEQPFLLGNVWGGFYCPFYGIPEVSDGQAACREAISYASYRLIRHRFRFSPGLEVTYTGLDSLMTVLGYDPAYTSVDYRNGRPAALGNYLAQAMIDLGLRDGANEANDYANRWYEPVNPPMDPRRIGSFPTDADRWQPLSFAEFIDQSGVRFEDDTPAFLGPEWGLVLPFALRPEDRREYERDDHPYWVYHDPGPPPYLKDLETRSDYQWGFELVALWSAHLDPADSVMWDISPAAKGNLDSLPADPAAWRDFYHYFEGGGPGQGHALNPHTGQPYPPNLVPRGDYTRVLAEFWADGPDSETPPGHWFTILNYVNDHPALIKRLEGQGPVLDDLAWDVMTYFALGGAMHDAAISAWSVKGWYDYVRPITAIRHMAMQGQRSDPNLPNYHPEGLPLIPGLIEVVQEGDPLAGLVGQHVGKMKLFGWRGPDYIDDPETDAAGVGWMLLESWWPYQRPTFVTPPFAGYVSGHSTYSRAAAEVLTLLTGDPFFPGGVGEFVARKNEFLVFEEGPSVDVVLQWATYRDASDQTSLSRIWGGIHPPADDIPGRLIGEQVGVDAYAKARKYFFGQGIEAPQPVARIFPNPLPSGRLLSVQVPGEQEPVIVHLYDLQGRLLRQWERLPTGGLFPLPSEGLGPGLYVLRLQQGNWEAVEKWLIQEK